MLDHNKFITTISTLCDNDRTCEAIDEIITYLDNLMITKQMAECDSAISKLCHINNLSSSMLVSVLGITLLAKTMLPSRKLFYAKAWKEIGTTKGYRYAKQLLAKYQ